MTAELKFQLALTEAKQSQLRAEHYNVRIETGAYKDRLVHKGSVDGPYYTEKELLLDEVATMNRHIQLAQEHIEYAKSILHEMQGG
jgi:hypothetical protein